MWVRVSFKRIFQQGEWNAGVTIQIPQLDTVQAQAPPPTQKPLLGLCEVPWEPQDSSVPLLAVSPPTMQREPCDAPAWRSARGCSAAPSSGQSHRSSPGGLTPAECSCAKRFKYLSARRALLMATYVHSVWALCAEWELTGSTRSSSTHDLVTLKYPKTRSPRLAE